MPSWYRVILCISIAGYIAAICQPIETLDDDEDEAAPDISIPLQNDISNVDADDTSSVSPSSLGVFDPALRDKVAENMEALKMSIVRTFAVSVSSVDRVLFFMCYCVFFH